MSHAWKIFCDKSGVDPNDRDAMRDFYRKPMPRNDDGTPAYVTQQSDKDRADINKIINRFDAKDIIGLQGKFAEDESSLVDVPSTTYLEAMQTQKRVESEFMELRADVRASFGNDPARYLDFLARPTAAKEQVQEVKTAVKENKTVEEPVLAKEE